MYILCTLIISLNFESTNVYSLSFSKGRVIRNILPISMGVRFKTPANFYICGASQCGKTFLVRSMLHHCDELFEPKIAKIIFCYGEYQSAFDSMMQTIPKQTIPNLTFVEGFPKNLNDMLCTNCLVIVDDLMSQCSQNQSMSDLFTKGSHHRGVSVMYLMQNLFPPGRQFTDHQFKLPLHDCVQKSKRFVRNFYFSPSNVPTLYKFSSTIFPRCHRDPMVTCY